MASNTYGFGDVMQNSMSGVTGYTSTKLYVLVSHLAKHMLACNRYKRKYFLLQLIIE